MARAHAWLAGLAVGCAVQTPVAEPPASPPEPTPATDAAREDPDALVVRVEADAGDGATIAFFIARSGAHLQTDPTPERRTADGAILSEARPIDPALVSE